MPDKTNDPPTLTIPHTLFGPQGQPYLLIAVGGLADLQEWHYSPETAQDRRDELLDAGYLHVRVLGLPTTASCV